LADGYENPQVSVGGSTITPTQSGGRYTVTEHTTVSISAPPIGSPPAHSYIVTVEVGAGISNLTPAGNSHPVNEGSPFTLTFSLADGYENPQVTANENAVTPTELNGVYTATFTVTENTTVSISASPIGTPPANSYTVTVKAGAGITNLTPAGNSHPVDEGSPFTLTFTLGSGYENPQVTVNENAITPTKLGGTYTVTFTVTQNATVSISATLTPTTAVNGVEAGDFVVATTYYTIIGQEVRRPAVNGIYLVKEKYFSKKITVTKRLIIVND
jgi:hypothetical protein